MIIKSNPDVGISVTLPDGSPVKTRPVIQCEGAAAWW
jgi:hypothetical protein